MNAPSLNLDPINNILSRLQGVRETKPDNWTATCPAHTDLNPSLAIARGDDGRVLLKCWAGCSAPEIVENLGLTLADLFERPLHHRKPSRKRIYPDYREMLKLVEFEGIVVVITAENMCRGKTLNPDELGALHRVVTNICRVRRATL